MISVYLLLDHSVGIMLGWDKALYQLNITSTGYV